MSVSSAVLDLHTYTYNETISHWVLVGYSVSTTLWWSDEELSLSICSMVILVKRGSGGSRIFLGAGTNSQNGIFLQTFCPKLHENERSWTQGGTRPLCLPSVRQCREQKLSSRSVPKFCRSFLHFSAMFLHCPAVYLHFIGKFLANNNLDARCIWEGNVFTGVCQSFCSHLAHGYSVTVHPCCGAVAMHPGMFSCYVFFLHWIKFS